MYLNVLKIFLVCATVMGAGANAINGDTGPPKKIELCNSKLPEWPENDQGILGNYTRVAVAADNGICSEIGRDILIKGGNAVDAVISTVLCIGVMDPHSSGLGGGHLMTIYNKTSKSCLIIDAREEAPRNSHKNMYDGKPDASQTGWLAVGVPGELHGLYTAFKLGGSGRISWKDLVMPVARLCEEGLPVSGAMAHAIHLTSENITNEKSMSIFFNPQTGKLYEEGEIMKREKLSDTLESLANASDPIAWFYNSEVTRKMVDEFKNNGGILTLEDFQNYKAKHGDQRPPITTRIGTDHIACGPPPPSSAAVTMSILNILQGYDITAEKLKDKDYHVQTLHRVLEAMKFAYGSRTLLGDMDFVTNALWIANNITSEEFGNYVRTQIKENAQNEEYYKPATHQTPTPDHGTTHVSVLDSEGNAVSVTSTINLLFGARVRSSETGIIWNDQMDDFSQFGVANFFKVAPNPNNYIEPGKRPQSSMSPIVIYNKDTGDVKIVAGSEGGSRIITAVAQTVMRMLWFGQDVREAVSSPRMHNQLEPFSSEHEAEFPEELVRKLTERGQNFTKGFHFGTTVTAIHRDHGRVYANSDYRKPGGYPSGY